MPDPLLPSLLCPVLIGRDAQVAVLARLLQQARNGHGQIALNGIKIQRLAQARGITYRFCNPLNALLGTHQ